MAKILLAEDDLFIRDIYSEVLNDAKYTLVTAADGSEALEKIRLGGWDIVLLDVMMPKMDGIQMLDFLKNDIRTSHIPIVLLTAKVQAVHDGSLSHLPVAAILSKPFDPLRLARQVADALGWDSDAIEAQAFGFLAARGLKGLPLSYPATTGVPIPMTGGIIARP